MIDISDIVFIKKISILNTETYKIENFPYLFVYLKFHPDDDTLDGYWEVEFAYYMDNEKGEKVEKYSFPILKREEIESKEDLIYRCAKEFLYLCNKNLIKSVFK